MKTPYLQPTSTSASAFHAPAHPASRRRRAGGFTLIELAAVMAVAAVLVGVGVPPLTEMVRSIRLSSASNDLLAGLHMARSEALKRNGRGVVCKSSDGVSCASTGGWEQGWMVFHDANNNGSRESGEAIVERGHALAGDLRVTGNLNVVRYVSYTGTGTTKTVGGGFQSGTLTMCRQSVDGGEARQIIISSSGRPRVQKTLVDSCT